MLLRSFSPALLTVRRSPLIFSIAVLTAPSSPSTFFFNCASHCSLVSFVVSLLHFLLLVGLSPPFSIALPTARSPVHLPLLLRLLRSFCIVLAFNPIALQLEPFLLCLLPPSLLHLALIPLDFILSIVQFLRVVSLALSLCLNSTFCRCILYESTYRSVVVRLQRYLPHCAFLNMSTFPALIRYVWNSAAPCNCHSAVALSVHLPFLTVCVTLQVMEGQMVHSVRRRCGAQLARYAGCAFVDVYNHLRPSFGVISPSLLHMFPSLFLSVSGCL